MNSIKEKLLKDTYEKFMKVSLNKLPVKLLDGITAENIMAYGTTLDEKLLSIQDCRDLVERQLEQSKGMKFKRERIPVTVIISPEEDSVIFVEELNLSIKSLEGTHKLFLRVTTALEYSDNKWKVVHFHTSKPDDASSERDTWHIDEWKKKSEELQKMVKEKTSDLVKKNHDLEIEASLERVRTVSMSMKNPDDLLDICEILFKELHSLGFSELRNTMVNIFNDNEETFLNYDYSDAIGKSITPLTYNIHPVIKKQVKQVRRGKDSYSETVFSIKDLKDWKNFRKSRGEKDDPRLNKATALHYYFYSIGTAAIGISTFSSITNEKKDILKRFRNVFDFSYRRYMDVAQAEAQAKEARLEASLERVRAQAMGINKSEQLGNISETVFTELKALEFTDLRNAEIIINSDTKESVISYYYSDYGVTETIEIFYNTHPKVKKWAEEMRKTDDAFTSVEFGESEIEDWRKYREEIGYLPDPKLNKAKAVYYYSYSIGPGALSISSFKPISSDQLRILERFKNVFGLAYRRYADVSLAEAQAREAKIEMALERVRSRTMAMQKSDELSETTFMLFQQFMDLGEAPDQITIGIINEEEKVIEFWTTMDGKKVDMMVKFPIKETDLMRKMHFAWKNQKKSLTIEIKGKELHDYIDYRTRLTGMSMKSDHVHNRRFIQAAFFSKGMITISTNDPRSNETLLLLERFAGVFDLTYTRFLDLQKAEAQAKEAKLEASLERVRSRSMAMHSSDELVDASVVLFNELKSLGIESIRTGVGIFDESKKAVEIWSSQLIEEKRNKILGVVPFKAHPFFELNYKAWKRKEPYFFYEITGKEVKKYYKVMSSVLSYPEKKEFNPKECFYTFFFPEGSLNVVSKNNLSEYDCNLMIRFTKVFGLIYRRFLDLQKAETQAREAQIELALERVRARTMAMHSSNELQDAAILLFQQIRELGLDTGSCGYVIWENEKKDSTVWMSSAEGGIQDPFKLPHTKSKIYKEIYSAKEEGKEFFAMEVRGAELRKHFDYLTTVPVIGEKIKQLRKARYKFPETIVYNTAFFKQGYLSFHTHKQIPEVHDIFRRFANVFEQTYTRFLDLQKAEAQGREAQIQLAMERVRARTMAMHESDELEEVSEILLQQLNDLGIVTVRSYIGIFRNNRLADLFGAGEIKEFTRTITNDKSGLISKIFDAWRKKKTSTSININGNQFECIAYFSNGFVALTFADCPTVDIVNLLERFAGVFNLTYTRFLDLQQAEVQAREAQIEAALERVRSRTMGMQKSEELKEVIKVVYEQFVHLNINGD